MPIIKIQKRKNPYVVLDKTFINDKQLSLKSKGLLAYLLSLPSNWEVHIKELASHFPDGKHAIGAALKELRQLGYVLHQRHRDESGVYTHGNYHVFEIPQLDPQPDNQNVVNSPQPENQDLAPGPQPDFPGVEDSDVGKPVLGNRSLINNKETKYTNNKKITAAIEASHPYPSSDLRSVAAASLKSEKPQETRIGDQLTEGQRSLVREVVHHFSDQHPSRSAGVLFDEIEYTLLDPKSFTQSGQDFKKKLNTIRKVIREGSWSPPALLQQEKQQELNQERTILEFQLRELNGEQQQLRSMLSALDKNSHLDICTSIHHQIIGCEEKIAHTVRTMTNLQNRSVT